MPKLNLILDGVQLRWKDTQDFLDATFGGDVLDDEVIDWQLYGADLSDDVIGLQAETDDAFLDWLSSQIDA